MQLTEHELKGAAVKPGECANCRWASLRSTPTYAAKPFIGSPLKRLVQHHRVDD